MIPRLPYRELSLHWQGQPLAIRYTPCWLITPFGALGHLELRAGAPLPVTETGYRSQFLDNPPEDFDPAAYVTAWLDREARSPAWQVQREAARQGSLF
jgi:hypothetical protein